MGESRAGAGALVQSREVLGSEYAKAIRLSKVNLGILSEMRKGASSGDLITARTFHIPACGGFMLHERTAEVAQFFAEGQECAMFDGASEMVEKVGYYLNHPGRREAMTEAGHLRCLSGGNSVNERARAMLAKVSELRDGAPALGDGVDPYLAKAASAP